MKNYFYFGQLVFAVILVACDDASTEVFRWYKDYFDKPQGQEVNWITRFTELIAEASVTSIMIVLVNRKDVYCWFIQFVLNTEAQEDVDATNNNLYFDFAQTAHVQLGAYTDNVSTYRNH